MSLLRWTLFSRVWWRYVLVLIDDAEGVGVVMDDVHPAEIEGEIGTDYLVALSASHDDVQQQARQFTVAPTSRRVYSARERAVLEEDEATIEAMGFADCMRVVPPAAELNKASEATHGPQTGDQILSEEDDAVRDAENGDDAPATATLDESDADAEGTEVALPFVEEPTQAERNEVEPPGEPTLPIGALLMESFRDHYRDYSSRVEARLAARASGSWPPNGVAQRYHLIHVLASQSPSVILDQCVYAITGVRACSLWPGPPEVLNCISQSNSHTVRDCEYAERIRYIAGKCVAAGGSSLAS